VGCWLELSARAIRFDRILDEAHGTCGDIRRLIDLFGASVETAFRYVKTANTATDPARRRTLAGPCFISSGHDAVGGCTMAGLARVVPVV
jgi:hypothetical protein